MKTTYFSIRQYARRLGISHTAVCKAIKAGWIAPNEYGFLDVIKADLDWIAHYDIMRCRLPQRARVVLLHTSTEYLAEQAELEKFGEIKTERDALFGDEAINAALGIEEEDYWDDEE